jgi:hypothetical protein
MAKVLLWPGGEEGQYAPEVSAGIPMVMLNSLNFHFSSDPGDLSVIYGLRQLILILALLA